MKEHKREGETIEEVLRRLIGGPNPGKVAGILFLETAEKMRKHINEKDDIDEESKSELRERFE